MSYIGNQPTSVAFLTDQFSGTGSQTAYTLSAAPANTASILVAVSGVLQDPTTYSTSGLTLTFSAAPPSGTGNISVRYLGIPASNIASTAYRTLTEFTATAGQTTFTVPSYTVGYINVLRNGVQLGTADFTATNGTTVVLATGATSGDLITTESFYVSSVLNAIPATAGAVTNAYLLDGSVTAAKMAGSGAWAPTGTILQVVSATDTTERPTTSTSFTANSNTLTVTLTPRSTTSKIFVSVTTVGYKNTDQNAAYTIYRNGTNLGNSFNGMSIIPNSNYFPVAMSITDSPGTTSPVTYQLYYKMYGGSGNAYINAGLSGAGGFGSITAMEIAG